MKIFIGVLICLVSLVGFAESFDLTRFEAIKKSNDKQALLKYCAQSTPTSVGIQNKQHFFAIRYLIGKSNKTFTKEQVLQIAKPFIDVAKKDLTKDMIQFIALQSANLTKDSKVKAQYIYKKYNFKAPFGIIANHLVRNGNNKGALQLANKYNLVPIKLQIAKNTKDYELLWKTSQQILCYKSGVKNAKKATQILSNMFRYKPQSVTKQQQIAVIQKLSKIYPIAGTDFNQWKAFVSFLSFRYKILTGKTLK